jgi:ABC-2 type transport system permease protein
MKSLLKMTWMESRLFLREPVNAFFTLALPLMMLFLAGTMPSARTAQMVGLALLYPMVFLSGAAGFPRQLLPVAAQKVAAFLPLTYVVDLLNGLWVGESWSQHAGDALVLAGILVAGAFIAVRAFRY